MSLLLSPWLSPVEPPELDGSSVHLWRFRLDVVEPLDHLLSSDERQRAGRLREARKARSWRVARGRLRQIIAPYIGSIPAEVRFEVGAQGKPHIADASSRGLFFNLSHAGSWGVIVISRVGEVGVDVEQVDGSLDYLRLAQSYFSPGENAVLTACPEHRRRREFFRLWTRKEAWLKGKGGGFSEPDIGLPPVFIARCQASDGVWQLRNFALARHYLAALAIPADIHRLQRWHFC